MNIKERIDRLMRNAGIKTYTELLLKIYKQLGDNSSAYEKAEREKGNFTKMLKGERELNSKYYVPLERIFNIRIADLFSDDSIISPMFCNRGLRYTASTNSYKEFETLGAEITEKDSPVIFHTDEYNKSIFDYIIEYRAGNGIRYLVDRYSLRYDSFQSSFVSPNTHCYCYGENIDKLANLLFEMDDGDTFTKLFNAYDMLANYYYDNGRLIYGKESFLKKILNSTNIFQAYLTKKECPISEINKRKQQDECIGVFINPILNKILELAFDDPKGYADKILAILEYGIENNPDVILAASQCDQSGIHTFTIKENGSVDLNYVGCGCVIVLKDNYINSDITSEMKNKMAQIREINNRILVRETNEIFGMKRLQKNKTGNVIKLHTDNHMEYEFYSKLKNAVLPIPELLGTQDGVDEFSAYVGQNYWNNYKCEMIEDAAIFLKKLHEFSMAILNGKVYVHGNLICENLYFDDDKLTSVVNWDNCHIGEIYEDLAGLILSLSGVTERYRDNSDVLERIELIFESYQADENIREKVITYIKKYLVDRTSQLDLYDEQDIKEYEILKWCETFFDIFSKQLIEGQL